MFDNTANELEEIIPVYENVVDTGSSPYTDEYSR